MNTQREIELEDYIVTLESANAVKAQIIDDLETQLEKQTAAYLEAQDIAQQLQNDCNALKAQLEVLQAIEASKHWTPAIGDRVRMISGTGHTRRLVACATIAEIVDPPDSHPYHLQVDSESMPLLWAHRDAMVKA